MLRSPIHDPSAYQIKNSKADVKNFWLDVVEGVV